MGSPRDHRRAISVSVDYPVKMVLSASELALVGAIVFVHITFFADRACRT
jgi:hypothetical protein